MISLHSSQASSGEIPRSVSTDGTPTGSSDGSSLASPAIPARSPEDKDGGDDAGSPDSIPFSEAGQGQQLGLVTVGNVMSSLIITIPSAHRTS